MLERNPTFREVFYDAQPAPDDAQAQAVFAQMKGKRLPIVDEVEVSIIEESQPMWLAFLNGQVDALATNAGRVPPEFLNLAMPGGKLAPFLAKQGIVGIRNINADSGLFWFNMEDPTVGGYTPDKVALRRAISLAWDVDAEITQIRRGGMRAQSPVVPHTTGFDPQYKSEMGDYDPTRAKALLDTYGYVDRDGDGWRDMPDGKPLLLEVATEPDQLKRKYDELWKKCMTPLGIRVEFKPAQWPENLKSAYAGKLMIWQLASSAAGKDGQSALRRLYSKGGNANLSRFKLEAFDKIYHRMEVIEDGPERDKLFLEAKRIAAAYMPYRYTAHRAEADMLHPWVVGFYKRPTFWQDWWHLVDIDLSKRARALTMAHDTKGGVMRASALLLAALLASAVALAQNGDNGKKVLRLAFTKAETTFDPAKISDLYSRSVTPHIFEGLYTYDHLARPAKIKPLTADGMPQVSSDFKVWTVKIKPGIYFADDPAFKGNKRELVAADYIYAMKRFVDPANKSPGTGTVLEFKLLGLRALHEDAVKNRKPFDYDTPIEGLKAIDRHTVQFAIRGAQPALHPESRRGRPVRRGGTRGGRALRRRRRRRAPGGHRPLPPEELAAQFAHRARTQPRLPRGLLRRPTRGRRRRSPGRARADEGQAAADRRRGRGLDHRRKPADVARVPEWAGRRVGDQRRARTARLPRARDARRQARAVPREAGHRRHPQHQR